MRYTKGCKDEPYDLEREREHCWWTTYSNIRGPEVGRGEEGRVEEGEKMMERIE